MAQHWSVVFALILALIAFVHYDRAFAAGKDTKPGVCPPRPKHFGLCVDFCFDDDCCPGDEKCCSNGCGHECRDPFIVKPGSCPIIHEPTICVEQCSQDGHCPGNQKCCKTCGHACMDPE